MKKLIATVAAVIVLSATAASATTAYLPTGGKYVPVPATGGPSGGPNQG